MNTRLERIVREELWRSIVWIGLGLIGWATLVDGTAWLDASVLTAFGLPVLTWAVLTAGLVGVRYVTRAELQAQRQRYSRLNLLFWVVVEALTGVYLVVVDGYPALWVSVAFVTIITGTIGWHWYVRESDSRPPVLT